MATRLPSGGLVLRFEGPKITAKRFKQGIDAFLATLEEVTREVLAKSGAKGFKWLIEVEPGSVVLRARPDSQARSARSAVRAMASGVTSLETGKKWPENFTARAVENARRLAEVVDPTGKEVTGVAVGVPQQHGKVISLTSRTAKQAEVLLQGDRRAIGTIQGRLRMLSEVNGLHFFVYDTLHNRKVRCLIGPERLAEAVAAFQHRVAVRGEISYRDTGEPLSIEVDSIFVFPAPDTLPSAEEVCGLLQDVE